MGAGDIARDRQAEAGAAFIQIARFIEPEERAEHVLAFVARDTWPIIIDSDDQLIGGALAAQCDIVRMALGIGDEIGHQPLEGERFDRSRRRAFEMCLDSLVGGARGLGDFSEQLFNIAGRADLAIIAAREGQIAFQHRLHFIDIAAHFLGGFFVAQQRQFQFETGQDRPQIVADA
jgi:hypothetical protein